jgi:hypothetical protein
MDFRPALVLAPLLALCLLITVGTAQTTKCAVFTRETCIFSPNLDVGAVRCKPRACIFPTAEASPQKYRPAAADPSPHPSPPQPLQAFECGFAETGYYNITSSRTCSDPFMDARHVSAPSCSARCCRPDLQGVFSADGTIPGTFNATRLNFRPYDTSCRYGEISRGQVMKTLEKFAAPLVVVGDSMMRQLFLRMVTMMRGEHRMVDYGFFTNAQYKTCDEADAFRVAGDLWKPPSKAASYRIYNTTYTKWNLRSFFGGSKGPGLVAAKRSLARCAASPVELDFLFSAEFEHQVRGLPAYVASLPSGVKPIIVLHVGFWEPFYDEFPREYLSMLSSLRNKARHIFIVGVATPLVTTPDTLANFKQRNAFMKEWVERRGAPYQYIEYDNLATAPGSNNPARPYTGDKHYMCRLVWNTKAAAQLAVDGSRAGIDDAGIPLPQVVSGTMERITVMEDLQCVDEMNRNLAQLVFNAIATTSP